MRKKKHKALEEQYDHYVCERCMEIGAYEVIDKFLEDLEHAKLYPEFIRKKWEAKKNERKEVE